MPMKPARVALLPLLVSTLLLSACQESEQQAEQQQQQQQTPTVGVVTLKAEHFLLTNDLPGRTAAYRIAEVRPQVNGILEKRLFEEGAEVEEGQQLYQIDDDVYQAALKSAEASSISTRSLAERYGILVKENAVSQQEYDEARAAGLQAQAALDEARINVRYTKVLAPISGRIGRSAVSEGALVTSGQSQQLATIQQLDPIYVDITQSSREMLNLRRDLEAGRLQKAGDNAAAVTLTLEDGSTYGEQGKLEFSEVSVDEGTGSVILRAVFPNPDRLLLPGMFVHAELVAGTKSDAILAPQQGITRTPRGNATAMVVNDENKVESRDVVTERTVGNRWLISSGLNEGDRLITEGLQYIRPGASVNVEPAGNVDEPAAQ
ncbi:efflux transporter periplasmic adaptor subunit [Halopseudomonas pachastrellae]|uniref:Efflux transporter periplasmic adaptor subunit n=1 Tax=Halopseudomonas pachastrellae TaxID=254161 RepID=A0A1S8DFF6_9GAMM|nr:efflux RND transporter periplasmic adaptor subunit [Halopseudomonas pachastrellae]ONM44165.1 efflux transporter periplasmic adaptor subunit [Halopseudomonas pachastrellae]SFM13669.1 membrane fusion protein, multidrug efflux system [Halopseudomonas pachastrellae]